MFASSTKSTTTVGDNFPVANNERKVTSMRKRLLILVALAAFLMAIASPANASYQRFLPNGLPTSSSKAATKAVLDYADLNQGYGKIIANQTGSASFNKSDYEAAGWGVASASTTNSALSGTGAAVPTDGGVGVKTVRIRNKKTGVLVNVMVRCGNPRLHKGPVKPRHVKVQKILRIYVNKKFTVTKTITCPGTGQQVTGSVTGYVRGWFRTKVKGWTTGAKLYYQQQVDLKVTNTLKLKCGKATAPAPAPTPSAGCNGPTNTSANASGVPCQSASQNSTQDSKQQTSCGDYSVNSCNTYNTQTSTQTTYQFNCSKVTITYSDGTSTETWYAQDGSVTTEQICSQQYNQCSQAANSQQCSETPPPPPPPPTDHAPQISCVYPAHVYSGDNVYIWCEASDPDGDALSVNGVSNNSAGHVSGTIPVNVRWDNTPCPSDVSCYRSTFWADSTGTASVTFTVTANGKSATSNGTFPVLNGNDGF